MDVRTVQKLKLIIVEDNENDAMMIARAIGKGGYQPEYVCVDEERAFREALQQGGWDLIISDYLLPRFDVFLALKLLQKAGYDIPFIVISGVVGEEKAVDVMLSGAHDYIRKDNLSRLIPAISRELDEAKMRHQRRQAELELEKYRNKLEELVEERTRSLKRVQRKLLRKERLAILGQLVASVSHELCNPLGVIKNTVYLLEHNWSADKQQVKANLALIEKEIDIAHRIISNLLESTRDKSPVKVKVDLQRLLDNLIEENNWSDRIQLHIECDAKPFVIYADEIHLKQIINNLITNAIYSADKNGHVLVASCLANTSAEIYILDNGMGVIESARNNLFEPLYTTKALGTGLGLWVSREIAVKHGGDLLYVSPAEFNSQVHSFVIDKISKLNTQLSDHIKFNACFRLSLPQFSPASIEK